ETIQRKGLSEEEKRQAGRTDDESDEPIGAEQGGAVESQSLPPGEGATGAGGAGADRRGAGRSGRVPVALPGRGGGRGRTEREGCRRRRRRDPSRSAPQVPHGLRWQSLSVGGRKRRPLAQGSAL